MADPSTYRPRPGEIPTDPGVYRFRDDNGQVIYVGKAKNLRARLSSYFQDLTRLHPRTRRMVCTGAAVEWTTVTTEVEALQLEYSWIKEFDPRFNVKYRDDKSYPYLAVSMSDEFPRAHVFRGAKKPGTRYFGPYAHVWALRETLDELLRVFPVRTCTATVFRRAHLSGRPCLLGYIDKCTAPCVGRINASDHRAVAADLCSFLAGDTGRFVRELEKQMHAAATDLRFEEAARLRDRRTALQKTMERSAVVLPDATDADVFGFAGDELEASVQVFHVRGGRIRGQRGWITEREDEDNPALIGHLLQQIYGGESGESVPREVLVPDLPEPPAVFEDWLSRLRGGRVTLRSPRRGDKATLTATVTRNAEQALARHKVTRSGDLTARGQALAELQEALGLDTAPLRIECFDVSHIQGTDVVASMVVFEDGLPRKNEYRRFIVHGEGPTGRNDDTAAMHEVLTRRFRRPPQDGRPENTEASSKIDPDTGRPRRFAYAPHLVVVDGGAPQVNAAHRALADAGVVDLPVVGLAKRLEEIWLPGEEFPVVLPRHSDGLFLLQRVRDEAHRFAITFHRKRRSKSMTASDLDDIPGLGPARRQALLDAFGTVRALREATPEELSTAPGIGPALARTVSEHLRSAERTRVPPIHAETGEILE
ncbi:Excinuclease ABC subunit C [Austwickia chelonae]|uniref:UvrABC system protein C n=1 Tax=Austwickia chelonae NBRC 105200 TaxID=1184607 RepID=K6VPB3_9MICO|nr:excinuclease ABC subunit UvrC [Austwickia chelonae]GAB77210.1 UvrABC system protein C [Austwickia chelonae NBRC 105200]SEW05228.1 Excinuclease ABC subunit C [Austwickia chelonae]